MAHPVEFMRAAQKFVSKHSKRVFFCIRFDHELPFIFSHDNDASDVESVGLLNSYFNLS